MISEKVSGAIGNVPGPPGGSRGSTRWGHLSQRAAWAKCEGGPAPGGLVCFPHMAHKAHNFSWGVPVTSRYSGKMPEPLGTIPISNATFQYMNLYLSTISRLLVMSVISSGTPNKLQSSNNITHNTNRHRTLSVRTLRVRQLCRHDRDTSPVNNQ